ncbi:Zygote arrest protein 1 [Merluccius polli]|uniref:Zygote arrest protein 1 n=1 Tax=Merluccius polli TaxID=89951 RepID=A0AA47M8A2_MERPO|nr:Zygote arrest protein 1 [Merluccius polli]
MEGYRPPVTGNVFFGGHPAAAPSFLQRGGGGGGGGGWGKGDGRFVTPGGLSYLDLCKVILSQVGPVPRFKKTRDTRDRGVQVNAKVDKTNQCSLGPKTLYSREGEEEEERERREAGAPKSPACTAAGGRAPFNTPVNHVRFSRPLSIYSPVFDRRGFTMAAAGSSSSSEGEGGKKGGGGKQGEGGCDACVQSVGTAGGEKEDTSADFGNSLHQGFKGSRFQFLEQRYGHFRCRKCNIRWESAYVWCISGTSKVYYKQLCRKCQVGLNPYKVESILCQGCLQTSCCCERKQRHINMKRPHRQDLCCRCKGTRLSCDATYSFKYIV